MLAALKAFAFIFLLFCLSSQFVAGNPPSSSSTTGEANETLKAEIEGLVLPLEQEPLRANLIARLMAAQSVLPVKVVERIFVDVMKSLGSGFRKLRELNVTPSSDVTQVTSESASLYKQFLAEKKVLWSDLGSEQRCMNLIRQLHALESNAELLRSRFSQRDLNGNTLHRVQRIEGALLQLEHLQREQQMQRSLVAGRFHWIRNQLQLGIQKAQENLPLTLPKQMLHMLLDQIPNATEALIRRAAPNHVVIHELEQLYSNLLQQIQALPKILLEEECIPILEQIEAIERRVINIIYPYSEPSIWELKRQFFEARRQQHRRALMLSLDLIWDPSNVPYQTGELFHMPILQDQITAVSSISPTIPRESGSSMANVATVDNESNENFLDNAARHEKHLLTLLLKAERKLRPKTPQRILKELLLSLQKRIQDFRIGGFASCNVQQFEQENNELLLKIQKPFSGSSAGMKYWKDLLDEVQEHDRQIFLFNEQLEGIAPFAAEEVSRLKELRRRVLQSMYEQQQLQMIDTLALLSVRRDPTGSGPHIVAISDNFHQVPISFSPSNELEDESVVLLPPSD